MKRFSLALLAITFLGLSGFSQSTDFGIWYCLKGSLALTRYLDFNLEGDIRTFENNSKIDEGFGEAGLSLKAFRFLSTGLSYRLTSKIEKDDNYYLRHKLFVWLKGKADIGRVGLSCRLMYEHQVKTYINNENDEIPVNHLRIKPEVTYDIPKSRFEPVIYYEMFERLGETSEKRLDKYRISAGMAYKINKRNKIEISYIFQRDYHPDLIDTNIISLSYDFKI
ncbi:MAG: DUF2490 domain-containing protein [Bacteroidales bacterium]|jgi:hypothetical protein